MTDIDERQAELYEWQTETYPESDVWTDISGIAEEFGELAGTQIDIHVGRATDGFDSQEDALKDAIGDLMVYLGQYAAKHDLSLHECYEFAAENVLDEDSRHG